MAKVELLAGTTSYIAQVFFLDTSKTDGSGLTGLTNSTTNLVCYYHRDTDTTATQISLVTMTVGTFTSSGFKEIDATNMPGWYQFCPPNTALASGAKSVAIHFSGAVTNMAKLPLEIELTATNNQDGVRGGMTALPNVAAGANGGLPTGDASARVQVQSGTGTGQIDLSSGQVKVQQGTSAGQLDTVSGRVKALVDIQKNTALSNFMFLMTDSTNHNPLTGKVDGDFSLKKESIDGAAPVSLSGTITEVSAANLPGYYKISFTAGEMNGDVIALEFLCSGSDYTTLTIKTSA